MFTIALFFIANALFCLAYIVRDMAWLRAITILASSSTLPYFYFQSTPLYGAMSWQIAFIAINTVNLTFLLLQRRPIKLTQEEQWLHDTTFSLLKPRRMRRLLQHAESHEIQSGEALIEQGKELRALIILLSGSASVKVNGIERATLSPGDFAGEMSFITGRLTSADVIANEPVRYLIWPSSVLERMYQRDPEIKNTIQSIIGFDMATKLARQAP
ncbi:cyclic nucleotide-binding domain-containing protein [Halomonas sp. SH5A2]|uniref:cyclic nucleotide-binding domain-containing protein n=1 Tax=Halomonas sp. SH5A2 TaxID=2749040 RepID=UPI00163E166E|nr:cyclic nucleotide-binding domain-containing protein [Halomonas sp. SH5A2]QNI01951.1 cyclic nucleotide-binding domain-containing protein [Halomonas sp. SH5A2]